MTEKTTMFACESSMITQGVVNNLLPILLVIFKDQFGVSYSLLANLLLLNFVVQLFTDIFAIKIVNKLGYRASGILAQCSAGLGLIFIATLTSVIPVYPALLLSVLFTAFGGGMLEVMVSPIVENLSYGSSSSRMSLLHSFYCWGQMLVVLISSLAIKIFSDSIWRIIPVFWAIVPAVNIILFRVVPIPKIPNEITHSSPISLFKVPAFSLMCILMLCAGASEIAMAQWASIFAQKGLGVNKFLGDILGPCLFAILMGTGRTLYGLFGSKLNLQKTLIISSAMCLVCYVATGVLQSPLLALIFCASTGFTVSIMWPGVYSYSAKKMNTASTAMYGILALFGDMGCSIGSWLCGTVSEYSLKIPSVLELAERLALSPEQMGLKIGIIATGIFPLVMLISLVVSRIKKLQVKSQTSIEK
ncbi:MAG: MFS transporter [Ruminococcaceae bacterium]|nr:MFS transporter [Oscillospiraceae bacterium]